MKTIPQKSKARVFACAALILLYSTSRLAHLGSPAISTLNAAFIITLFGWICLGLIRFKQWARRTSIAISSIFIATYLMTIFPNSRRLIEMDLPRGQNGLPDVEMTLIFSGAIFVFVVMYIDRALFKDKQA